MKKLPELERMSPMERRRFMKWMSAALAAPFVPRGVRWAANAVAGGEAYAADAEDGQPRYFIEIDLRDQWDHGHLMVAPGLATATDLPRPAGTTAGYGTAALFFAVDELSKHEVNGTDVYLTHESRPLADHLDTIALIDLCDLNAGDIHGHEAANPTRSPGRTKTSGGGRGAMWNNDPISNFPQGCEAYYSSTPTPATMVNAWAKAVAPQLKNGVAFKGISRNLHTAYHHAAGLGPGAELDRHYSRDTLFAAFPDTVADYNVLDRPEQAEAFARVLERTDARLLDRRRYADPAIDGHGAELAAVRERLYVGEPRLISLPMTEAEDAFWGAGVPDQVGASPRAQIWEQVAWAYKMIEGDQVRSIALEFDWLDTHDSRSETQLRFEAAQVTLPLVRLISKLKEIGVYERTTIAIYTTDGSRSPDGGSSGDTGKNSVLLAGGGIKGGYYGDIGYDGGRYVYRAPDEATGAPRPGVTDNGGRLSAARMWRTVMKAAGVPDDMAGQFPDVANAQPLSWLLRG